MKTPLAAERRNGAPHASTGWNEAEFTQRVASATPIRLQAIADALRTFPADEIVIAAQPERSTRLVDELVSRARPLRAPRFPRQGVAPKSRPELPGGRIRRAEVQCV
jgi:hypothetical protein